MPKENKNGKALSEEKLDKVSGGGNFRHKFAESPSLYDSIFKTATDPQYKPLKNKNPEIGGNKSWAKRAKTKRN